MIISLSKGGSEKKTVGFNSTFRSVCSNRLLEKWVVPKSCTHKLSSCHVHVIFIYRKKVQLLHLNVSTFLDFSCIFVYRVQGTPPQRGRQLRLSKKYKVVFPIFEVWLLYRVSNITILCEQPRFYTLLLFSYCRFLAFLFKSTKLCFPSLLSLIE